jgi:ferredoxin-NADP reductase
MFFRVATPRRPSRLLAAAVSLTTPLLPEDYVGLVNPLWSTSGPRGRVVEVRPETDRAATLRIRPGRGWTGHRAGQYVRIGVDVDGVRHWRTYSLTNPESADDRCLSITVQALDGGAVSPHLVHSTPVGTIVHLEAAEGDFVLPNPVTAPLLMITAGSGITPVMGMLRTLAERGPLPDLVLLHSAPSADDVIFRDELRALGGARVVLRHTAAEGRLDLAELDTLCPDWRDRDAYVCGPSGLLDAAEAHWAEHPERLHLERFTPPVRSAGGTGGTVRYGSAGAPPRDAVHPQGHRHPAQARARQPRRAAVLAAPAGLAGRHRRPLRGQDPREHGDRPQRPARPVGLDARPEDPLHHLGVGHASPAEQWKHSHNELHHTYTNVVGKDNDLGYGIMRVDEDQKWQPFYLGQPLWNFLNAASSSTASRLRPRARREPRQAQEGPRTRS